MKKYLLLLVCGAFLTSGLFAQSAEPRQHAQALTDKMKTELELRDDQVIGVHNANVKMLTDLKAAGGASADIGRRKEIRSSYRDDLKLILDRPQQRKAKKMETVFKERRQAKEV